RYSRNVLTDNDLVDFTPELKAQAQDVLKRYKNVQSPFAPGVVGDTNGILGAIIPGTATNWPGFGYDPDTHTAFMPTGNIMGVRTLVQPSGEFSDIRYVAGIPGQFRVLFGPGHSCAVGSPQTAERSRAS